MSALRPSFSTSRIDLYQREVAMAVQALAPGEQKQSQEDIHSMMLFSSGEILAELCRPVERTVALRYDALYGRRV
jgi:hypothetical protein